MARYGLVNGKTFKLEERWARGDISSYPRLARELMALRPALIVTACGPSLRAVRDVSRTVPVIANCADETNFLGEIASLARPGGNTTGVTFLSSEAVSKRIELVREIVPGLARLAVLYQTSDPLETHQKELDRAAPRFSVALQRVAIDRAEDLGPAFEAMVRERAQAVFIFPTNRLFAERVRVADLARKHRLPTVFELDPQVDAGGLLSYGGSIVEWLGETTPAYVARILKGAKAGELPIVQPTRFDLVINAKTAKEIGIKLPPSLIARATRVVE